MSKIFKELENTLWDSFLLRTNKHEREYFALLQICKVTINKKTNILKYAIHHSCHILSKLYDLFQHIVAYGTVVMRIIEILIYSRDCQYPALTNQIIIK